MQLSPSHSLFCFFSLAQYSMAKAEGSAVDLCTCMCLTLVLMVFLVPTEESVDVVAEEASLNCCWSLGKGEDVWPERPEPASLASRPDELAGQNSGDTQ